MLSPTSPNMKTGGGLKKHLTQNFVPRRGIYMVFDLNNVISVIFILESQGIFKPQARPLGWGFDFWKFEFLIYPRRDPRSSSEWEE